MIFFRYSAHLEAELLKQESMLKNICAEKERQIVRLTEENKRLQARCDRLELIVIPALRPITERKFKAPEVTDLAGETSWQAYLNKHIENEEKEMKKAKEIADGIHVQGREGVHQSAGGDAARPNGAGGSGKASA